MQAQFATALRAALLLATGAAARPKRGPLASRSTPRPISSLKLAVRPQR